VSKKRPVADRAAVDRKADLDRKLATGAWMVFFVAWGVSQWMESANGASLRNAQYLMVGLILLGLNLVRFLRSLPLSRLTLTLGLIAAASGLFRLLTRDDSLIPLVPIALLSVLAIEWLARWMGPASA